MSASVTIIVVSADDPEAFASLALSDRKRELGAWKAFEIRSGRLFDVFLTKATKTDLGVFACADREERESGGVVRTRLLSRTTLVERIPYLAKLVETSPNETARSLQKHGVGKADVARIAAALLSGTWPTSGDPAEEAAAFARQLLTYARKAKERKLGICWEYRGKLAA